MVAVCVPVRAIRRPRARNVKAVAASAPARVIRRPRVRIVTAAVSAQARVIRRPREATGPRGIVRMGIVLRATARGVTAPMVIVRRVTVGIVRKATVPRGIAVASATSGRPVKGDRNSATSARRVMGPVVRVRVVRVAKAVAMALRVARVRPHVPVKPFAILPCRRVLRGPVAGVRPGRVHRLLPPKLAVSEPRRAQAKCVSRRMMKRACATSAPGPLRTRLFRASRASPSAVKAA